MKPLKALKDFLGLDAGEEPQPEENHFSQARAYFIVMPVFILGALFLNWPDQGIPLDPALYSTYFTGGKNWVRAENLSTLTQALAWLAFLWKFLVYLVLALYLGRIATIFNHKANFTPRVLAIARWLPVLTTSSLCLLLVLQHLLGQRLAEELKLENPYSLSIIFSDWGISIFLLTAAIFLIEGFLRRGLTLQEESDSTI